MDQQTAFLIIHIALIGSRFYMLHYTQSTLHDFILEYLWEIGILMTWHNHGCYLHCIAQWIHQQNYICKQKKKLMHLPKKTQLNILRNISLYLSMSIFNPVKWLNSLKTKVLISSWFMWSSVHWTRCHLASTVLEPVINSLQPAAYSCNHHNLDCYVYTPKIT